MRWCARGCLNNGFEQRHLDLAGCRAARASREAWRRRCYDGLCNAPLLVVQIVNVSNQRVCLCVLGIDARMHDCG